MPVFHPTMPPRGRLARLGVVLDARNHPSRLAEIAAMCDRAGIGAVWVDDPRLGSPATGPVEAWTALALVAGGAEQARLGAMLDLGRRPPALLAAMAATLAAASGGRLELTLRAEAGAGGNGSSLAAAVAALRGDGVTVAVELGDAAEVSLAVVAEADDVLLPLLPVAGAMAAARAVREGSAAAGRDPATLGVAARMPVSVGRTTAEAWARWQAEPAFAVLGRAEDAAVFGTLEQCHETVIALAHAGVTDLRCLLPNSPDVHDAIAQITAMTVGTVDRLTPGTPRSPAPPPPPGWGGRPRHPRNG